MIKRILGIIAIILLAGMYVATLVFVIIGNMTLFRAFLAADVVIPVVLWVLRIFINIGKPDNSEFDEAVKNNSEEKK
ncbi:MAG: hypothetical protein PUG68_09850 [Lachnospiraceae bacterium]|nr:hypothetical protein [Lachnospiraceae bacterium]MDD7328078.1 hypothetical protein [Lachnospiraceae bacterium]MDY2759480.1 hypothetical protein [Lachnospiraceae bacterium]